MYELKFYQNELFLFSEDLEVTHRGQCRDEIRQQRKQTERPPHYEQWGPRRAPINNSNENETKRMAARKLVSAAGTVQYP